MKVAVVIPFRGNPDTLSWVLAGLAEQQLRDDVELEVCVGGDGCELPVAPQSSRIQFTMRPMDHVGVCETKNRLMRDLDCEIVIFLNSDTRPMPGMVQSHIDRLSMLPARSMVLGAAPYEQPSAPTVFDVFKSETPAVFFYSQMTPGQSYDFRHAWTLNLSARFREVMAGGAFTNELRPCFYDDLEMAYRVLGSDHRGIFYDDRPTVIHRHPMTLEQYLDREELLGLMSPVLHRLSPGMFAELHGTDWIETLAEQFRNWITMDSATHRWTYRRLKEWIDLPAAELGKGAARQRMLNTIYQLHVPLKRLSFRLGFLRGMEMTDDRCWQDRKPASLWKKMLEIETV
jgi:hypothetical protein